VLIVSCRHYELLYMKHEVNYVYVWWMWKFRGRGNHLVASSPCPGSGEPRKLQADLFRDRDWDLLPLS